jgi:hypothetical protein
MHGSIEKSRCWLLLVAALLATAGCSSSTGTVRGKVSCNGTMLKGGKVTFFYPDGRGIPSGIQEDGSDLLEKLPLGPVKICVDTSSLDPRQRRVYAYAPPPGMKPPPDKAPSAGDLYVPIPWKYIDRETTDLTWEVKGGRQTYDIELK